MDFTERLRAWLAHHPLKEPIDVGRAAYTAEVMAKVQALAPAPTPAWSWPRLVVGLATAAASVLVVFTAYEAGHRRQIARAVIEQAEVLAALDEEALPLEEAELLLLAETPAADEQWLEELSQVLEALDEEVPLDDMNGESDEEWLKTLERLDEPPETTRS